MYIALSHIYLLQFDLPEPVKNRMFVCSLELSQHTPILYRKGTNQANKHSATIDTVLLRFQQTVMDATALLFGIRSRKMFCHLRLHNCYTEIRLFPKIYHNQRNYAKEIFITRTANPWQLVIYSFLNKSGDNLTYFQNLPTQHDKLETRRNVQKE